MVKSVFSMERLVNITQIVNEQTESIGLGNILIVRIERCDLCIKIRLEIRVAIFAREPCNKVWNGIG